MKLSAPIYRLKRRARLLSRQEQIPHHEALDRVAAEEGFSSWSLLASRTSSAEPAGELLAAMQPGDLVLLGARPGHGKTLLSLELAVQAMKAGRRGAFFTLEYTEADIVNRFRDIGEDPAGFGEQFLFDNSDAISAGYITERLESAPEGTVVVVDYLQALDQKRDNPDLMAQIQTLRAFAQSRNLVMIFISQIDRSYDPAAKSAPDLGDVRLPNPLDLSLFSKTCFLHEGEIQFAAAG